MGYIAVCIPLHAKSYCTVARARIAVVVTWILSLAICSPVTLRSTFSAKNIPGLDNERNNCELSWSGNAGSAFAMSMLLVTFVLPLGAMLPAYLKVMKVLLRSSKSSGALQAGNGSKKGEGVKDNSTRSRMQVVKMLVVMLIVFVLCWGPLTIYEYLLANNTISAMPAYHRLPWFILSSVAFGNSFLNPVIYFTLSRTYREFMIWAMRRLFCCCPSVRNGGAKLRRNTTVSEVSSSVTYAISDEVPATPGGGNLKKQGTSGPDGAQ
ncbi:QRFP-like peptide receptor [Liolophura sinensis]|uniref:QRFP-like peptide receptor n=1 Tax=Liolophura sinensis TaxID=3198878 RepID=UPI003158D7A8